MLRKTRALIFWFASMNLAFAANVDAQSRTRTLTIGGAGSMIRAAKSFSQTFEKTHPGVRVEVEPGSSRSAVRDLRAARLDIGLAGHAIPVGDSRGLYIEPVDKQAILLVTYPQNPVNTLSLAQIRGIYLDDITNWQRVGGEDQIIVPFTRRKNSTIRQIFMDTLFSQHVAADEKAFRIAKDKVLKTIKKIQGALGFASTSLKKAKEGGVKVLAVNGNPPTHEKVKHGTYPFSRTLLVMTARPPSGLTLEWIRGFVTFVRKESSAQHP